MSTMQIVRTQSNHPDFQELVKQLDAYLAIQDGEEHAFYNQFNSIETLQHVVVVYANEKAVACGAFKAFDAESVEIKRMYTHPNARGKGFATKVLSQLETWAQELNFKKTVLETGKRQPEAVALYEKCGYVRIENYGQYSGMENSLCFEKILF